MMDKKSNIPTFPNYYDTIHKKKMFIYNTIIID